MGDLVHGWGCVAHDTARSPRYEMMKTNLRKKRELKAMLSAARDLLSAVLASPAIATRPSRTQMFTAPVKNLKHNAKRTKNIEISQPLFVNRPKTNPVRGQPKTFHP